MDGTDLSPPQLMATKLLFWPCIDLSLATLSDFAERDGAFAFVGAIHTVGEAGFMSALGRFEKLALTKPSP